MGVGTPQKPVLQRHLPTGLALARLHKRATVRTCSAKRRAAVGPAFTLDLCVVVAPRHKLAIVSAPALETLVHALLIERTEGLAPAELGAYIDGWSSLLDLVRRSQLLLPHATPEDHARIAELVERIRAATAAALDDGTG